MKFIPAESVTSSEHVSVHDLVAERPEFAEVQEAFCERVGLPASGTWRGMVVVYNREHLTIILSALLIGRRQVAKYPRS